MARKGKINEVFDFTLLDQQQQKAVAMIREFVDELGKVKPVALKLQGAEKVGDIISGIKQLGTATVQLVDKYGNVVSAIQQVEDTTKRLTTTVKTSADESVKATKKQVDEFTLLNNKYKEAERNAQSLAAKYGLESKEAMEAARAADLLKQKRDAARDVVKNVSKQQAPSDVSLSSPSEVQGSKQVIEEMGEAVSELDKQQADAANSATTWGRAQGEAAEETKKAAEVIEHIATPLEDYTGTLDRNIKQNQQYKNRLSEIGAELKSLKKDLDNGVISLESYEQKSTALVKEQTELKIASSELGQTINSQIKYLQAADGSYDQLNATLGLYRDARRQMTEEEKNSPFGQQLLEDINVLDKKLKEEDAVMGNFQRHVGDYANQLSPFFEKLTDRIEKLKVEQAQLQAGGVQDLTGRTVVRGFSPAGGQDPERLNQVNAELDRLNKLQETGFKLSGSYNQQINTLDKSLVNLAQSGEVSNEFIEELNNTIRGAKINSAGFIGSAKIIAEAFNSAREKLEQFNSEGKTTGPEVERVKQEFEELGKIVDNPRFLNIAGRVGDSNLEVRQFTKTLIELEKAGLGNSNFANDLRSHLAELKDQVEDTRQEIKAMSSDSRAFDQVSSSVNFLANTYQTLVGVQALYGDQSAETEETIKKLVAVQAVANGMQEIANQLTQRGTLVNKAFTFVQTQYAIATDRSAAATVRLGAATKLLGIGLLVAAVATVVYFLNKWSSEASRVITQQSVLNNITRAAADNYGKEKAQLDVLISTLKTEGITRKEKFETLKELQEKYPGYFDNIKTEKDLNEKLAEAYQKASQGILLKAQAQAAGDLLAQNSSKRLEAEIKLAERISQINATFKAGGGVDAAGSFKKQLEAQRKLAVEQFKSVVDPLDKTNQYLIQSIQDANSAIQKLGGKPIKEEASKTIEQDLKTVFELRKKYLQDQIDLQKSISEMEGLNEAVRVDARKKQLDLEKQLLKEETEFEIIQVNLKQRAAETAARKEIKDAGDLQAALNTIASNAANERALIYKNAADSEVAIGAKASVDIIAIRKEANEKLKQEAQETEDILKAGDKIQSDKKVDFFTNALSDRLQNIKKNANEELQIELDKYTRGKISKEKYEEEKAKIEAKAHRESILAQIAYYENLIKLANLSPEKEKEALKALQDYKQQLYDADVKAQEDANTRKGRSNEGFFKKYKDSLKELGSQIQDTVFSVLEGGIDRQKNAIQEQLDGLDEQKEKQIEVVNQTIVNEKEKADAIAGIEARTRAQKDQLEKRQRQLDEQKAKYDRARAVANIIQNTAQGITAALGKFPPDPILAAIIGAIGAAQLVKVLATPLPKYKDGTEDHPGGLAEVGDGGKKEYVQTPDGTIYETPDTPTVVDLPKHSKVFKDEFALMDAMHRQHVATTTRKMDRMPNDFYQFQNMTNEIKGMRKGIDQMRQEVVKAVKDAPQPVIRSPHPVKEWVHSKGSTKIL